MDDTLAGARLTDGHIEEWASRHPAFDAGPEEDARRLMAFVSEGEAMIASFPPKPLRDAAEHSQANRIREACREQRSAFLSAHADWLYDRLTEGRTQPKRLAEIARDTAELCGGLVPSESVMQAEAARRQAEKEGHEADQGLLFHAFLSRPAIATHLQAAMQRPKALALSMLPDFQATGRAVLPAVTIERRGVAAHLTITNTHCLNAEDLRHVEDMEVAVDLALMDEAVHVCVLRGGEMTHPRHAGRRVFSAGVNLKALAAGEIPLVEFFLSRELGYINKIMRGLAPGGSPARRIEKPWIGVVDRFAIGGGAQLLLVMDQVIAASDSYISLPAAQEGIVPGFANLRLTRFLGSRLARQMIIAGKAIRATYPEAALLVDRVVNSEALDGAVDEMIPSLDNPAVVANRRMLRLAEEPDDRFLAYAAEFALEQAQRIYSADVLDNLHRAAARREGRS